MLQNKFIVVFNGPPGSGKDTAAQLLMDSHMWDIPVLVSPMAMSMRLAGMAMLGHEYSDELYAELKETPIDVFNGLNFRQWMIDFSESYMKPNYGEDVWGRLKVEEIKNRYGDLPALIVMPDGGFYAEQRVIVESVGAENYQLVHLHRDGCDWSKDSRRYIEFNDPTVNVARLDNDNGFDYLCESLRSIILRRGWNI